MHIKIRFEGALRKVSLVESKQDPSGLIYDCTMEYQAIQILFKENGECYQLINDKPVFTLLAFLIGKEFTRTYSDQIDSM